MARNRIYTQIKTRLARLERTSSFALAWWSVCLAVCIYMLLWHNMPLFPDEVGEITRNARYFFDEGVIYGPFPICQSSANAIPLFYHPAAIVVTELNSFSHWGQVRIIPLLSLAGLIVAVFTFSKRSEGLPGSALFISAGFIGVAGSGLILSRPELHLVFHGAACLFAYSYCYKNRVSKSTALALLILLIVASNISFFVHSQGLIFAPLTLLLMYRLSKSFDKLTERVAVISSTLYVSLSVWYGAMLYRNIFRCTESQAITDFISYMTLPGWLNSSDASSMSDRIKQEFFVRYGYFDKFEFAQKFQIDYLPPTSYKGDYLGEYVGLLNSAINLFTAAILMAFIFLCIFLLVRAFINLNALRREKTPWLIRLVSFATSNEIMFLTVCWGHLGLLFIATQMNFYRAFYLNLAMVVLLFIAFHQTKNRFMRKASLLAGLAALSVCGASIVYAGAYFYPQLRSGYAGPSIPLNSDWRRIETEVDTLKNTCGISDTDTRVIVDDLTYDALKKHREYLTITYIKLGSEIMKTSMQSALEHIKPTAAITRCDYFESYNIPYKGKLNGLCCATFNNDASTP